jgi:hypothetical protein
MYIDDHLMYNNSIEFNKYINNYKCNSIIKIVKQYNITDQEMKKYLHSIEKRHIKFKWRLFLLLPLFMIRIVIKHRY